MAPDSPNIPTHEPDRAIAIMGWCGLLALPVCLWSMSRFQFNVANYSTETLPNLPRLLSLVFAVGGVGLMLGVAAARCAGSESRAKLLTVGAACLPFAICIPMAGFALWVERMPFGASFLLIGAAGCAGYRLCVHFGGEETSKRADVTGFLVLLMLVLILTIVHTRIQRNYYDHFLLGHADIGHYLEEMKNCLAGRGLRSDSFDFVRHGWHFVPLFHAAVPFFWMWPSETFWMVFGAFTMHATALIAYLLARRVTGSALCALCWGIAWLLLPSVGRMIYCNTYGFQWTCVAIPLMALMIYLWYAERPWASAILAILVLLTQETNSSSILGWGLFLAIFTKRRIWGMATAMFAVVYLAVCLKWVIPHFSHGIAYQRFDLFGTLGPTIADVIRSPYRHPGEFFARLWRVEVFYYLGMLLIPLAGLPLRGWRLAIAAVPGLVLVLLMQNPEYLSVKFWHHSAFLPFLFFAGLVVVAPPSNKLKENCIGRKDRESGCISHHAGRAGAALMAALFAHYFFGFSPVSRPYASVAADKVMNRPDPRLVVVEQFRREISRSKTILATERLAAHFWDYRRIYTGRFRPVDYVIIDRRDTWDRSEIRQAVDKLLANPDYFKHSETELIVVFQRRADAPAMEQD